MSGAQSWIIDRLAGVRGLDWPERLVVLFVAGVAVLVAVVVALLIYNERGVTGTVTGKDFTAAHTVQTTRCAITPSGGCAVVVVPEYRPDEWQVTVAPDDGTSSVVRVVSEAQWEQINVGDRWSDDRNR